jgi:hypothetical protein
VQALEGARRTPQGASGAKSLRTRTKSTPARLLVPFTSCAFAAVDDDTSNPETAAMYNNDFAAPAVARPTETRLTAVVDLCANCRMS